MSKDIERLKTIGRNVLEDPNMITDDDIRFVSRSIKSSDDRLVVHSYWTMGQIGINNPQKIAHLIDDAFAALKSRNWEIREKALFAIGKIGRAEVNLVSNRIDKIIQLHCDPMPKVRLSMLWACQSIAHAKAKLFKPYIGLFERLLDDPDQTFVQEQAPEIFRIIGKYEPEIVERSLDLLKEKLQDSSKIIQEHAADAIRTIERNLRRMPSI